MTDLIRDIAESLSPAMVEALLSGNGDEHPCTAAHPSTLRALNRRELIHHYSSPLRNTHTALGAAVAEKLRVIAAERRPAATPPVEPDTTIDIGFFAWDGMRWANLVHEATNGSTSVPVKRLERATSQPAISQVARPATYTEAIRPYVDAVEKAVADLIAGTRAPVEPELSPITRGELRARLAEHPVENLVDLGEDVTGYVIRRAKYDALKAVLRVIDGWEGAGRELPGVTRALGKVAADRFREMVNDAAREAGCPEPYRPTS